MERNKLERSKNPKKQKFNESFMKASLKKQKSKLKQESYSLRRKLKVRWRQKGQPERTKLNARL